MSDLRTPANPHGGYNIRALREMVKAARMQGATDDELVAELATHPVLGPKLAQMQKSGASAKQALDNAAVILPEEKYDAAAGMTDQEKFAAGAVMAGDKAIRGAKQFFGGLLPDSIVSKEAKAQWAKDNADADRRNADLRNTGWGAGGEIVGDILTTMIPGMGATGAALRFLPKLARAPGVTNLAARAGRALTGAAAGGAGVAAVTPTSEVLDSAESYGDHLGRGAAEGVVGDVAGRGVGRFIKPLRFNVDPAHKERLDRLLKAGIGRDTPANGRMGGFDAAQLTGDQTLQDLKSALSKLPATSSRAQERTNAQLGDFTQSVMARTGTPSRNVSPRTLLEAESALAGRQKAIEATAGPVPLDRQYRTDLLQGKRNMATSVGMGAVDEKAMVPIDKGLAYSTGHRKTLPPEEAFRTRSAFSQSAHEAYRSDQNALGRGYETAQDSLDEAIKRALASNDPNAPAAWDALRKNWGAYFDVSDAAGRPGGRFAEGDALNPKSLVSSSTASHGRGTFASGQAGEIAQIADDAAKVLLDRIPNSGTPQRSLYSMLLLGGPQVALNAAEAGGLPQLIARTTMLPALASLMLHGKGFLGKKHIVNGLLGERGSNAALSALEHVSPAFVAAMLERERMEDEGEMQ